MSEVCSECGQTVSKAETPDEIFAALKKYNPMWRWGDQPIGVLHIVPHVGTVRVIDKSDNIDEDPGYATLDIYMVFDINGVFYRLDGELSSYEGHDWNSYIRRVQKQVKEVYVYE